MDESGWTNISPVVAFAVQKGLGIAIQITGGIISPHALLIVIQGNEERRFLNAVQRSLIHSWAEELFPGLRPRDSGKWSSKHLSIYSKNLTNLNLN